MTSIATRPGALDSIASPRPSGRRSPSPGDAPMLATMFSPSWRSTWRRADLAELAAGVAAILLRDCLPGSRINCNGPSSCARRERRRCILSSAWPICPVRRWWSSRLLTERTRVRLAGYFRETEKGRICLASMDTPGSTMPLLLAALLQSIGCEWQCPVRGPSLPPPWPSWEPMDSPPGSWFFRPPTVAASSKKWSQTFPQSWAADQ